MLATGVVLGDPPPSLPNLQSSFTEVFVDDPMGVGRMEVTLELRHRGRMILRESVTPIETSQCRQGPLKQRWWEGFARNSAHQHRPSEHLELHDLLTGVLGRRHGLLFSDTVPTSERPNDPTSLQSQFERAIQMLLGFESVKLAMQTDVELEHGYRTGKASLPVPKRPRMRSLRIPDFHRQPIEDIAVRVPEECFYLRTGDTKNYQSFRSFLTDWGGNLDQIVSSGMVDRNVRGRLEKQLAIRPDEGFHAVTAAVIHEGR